MSILKIIVGLGNPGKRYVNTPHNIGFEVVDYLARRWSGKWKRSLRFKADIAKVTSGSEQILLVKPRTYMNNSGQAVGAIMRFYKLLPDDLIVVLDDVAIDLGRLRIRGKGSSGGHNGLASVIAHTGTDKFVRVRVGVGRQKAGDDLVRHVLSPFPAEDEKAVSNTVARAADAVCTVVEFGVETAMNKHNGLHPENQE